MLVLPSSPHQALGGPSPGCAYVCVCGCGVALYVPRRWHCCWPACLLGHVLDRLFWHLACFERSTLHRPILLLCYYCHRCPSGGGGAAYALAFTLLFWSVQPKRRNGTSLSALPLPSLNAFLCPSNPMRGGWVRGKMPIKLRHDISSRGGGGNRIHCRIRGVV
jgi:hypothetical protein